MTSEAGETQRGEEAKSLPELEPESPDSQPWFPVPCIRRVDLRLAAEPVALLGDLPYTGFITPSFLVKEGSTDQFSYIKSICSNNGNLRTRKKVNNILRNNLEHIARKMYPPNSTLWFDCCELQYREQKLKKEKSG